MRNGEKKRHTPEKQTAASQETPFHVKTCLRLCEKDTERLMDDLVYTARGVQGGGGSGGSSRVPYYGGTDGVM